MRRIETARMQLQSIVVSSTTQMNMSLFPSVKRPLIIVHPQQRKRVHSSTSEESFFFYYEGKNGDKMRKMSLVVETDNTHDWQRVMKKGKFSP